MKFDYPWNYQETNYDFVIISGGIEVHWFAKIRLILETKVAPIANMLFSDCCSVLRIQNIVKHKMVFLAKTAKLSVTSPKMAINGNFKNENNLSRVVVG